MTRKRNKPVAMLEAGPALPPLCANLFLIREFADLANANLNDEKIEVLFINMNLEGIGFNATSIINPCAKIAGTLARPTSWRWVRCP